jgi:hypothetical protein
MTVPTPTVEIGFDLTESPIGPFIRLDDPVEGTLDTPGNRLGGAFFYDVTDRVTNITASRGRPSIFSGFPAGQISIELNNHDRAFDPLFAASPFYGNIIPRREIRLSVGSQRVFSGWIEDWDLNYLPNGDSTVMATGFDAFYIIANQTLSEFTPAVETADSRINTILSRTGVDWPVTLRDLEPSTQNMGAYLVEDGTSALTYLQNVAQSEPGEVFVDKTGRVAFRNRDTYPTSDGLVTLGNGGIPVDDLRVIYGAEQLFNEITITRKDGGTAIASDISSQNTYGIRAYGDSDLLVETDDQIATIAVDYASRFSQPEYRIESTQVDVGKLSAANEQAILGLELGDVVKLSFTPNNIPPAITKYLRIINIEHSVNTSSHHVIFGFKEITYAPLVLDDAVFGILDEARLGR